MKIVEGGCTWIMVEYRDGGDRPGCQPVAGSGQCEGWLFSNYGSVKASIPNVEIHVKIVMKGARRTGSGETVNCQYAGVLIGDEVSKVAK